MIAVKSRFVVDVLSAFSDIVCRKFPHSCCYHPLPGLFTPSVTISHTIRLKLDSNSWKNSKQREQNSVCLYAGRTLECELYLCVIHHGLKLSSCTLIKGWTIHKHCYYGESVMILALESSFPDLDELWPNCPLSIRLVVFSASTQNVVVRKAAKSCYGSLSSAIFHCWGICYFLRRILLSRPMVLSRWVATQKEGVIGLWTSKNNKWLSILFGCKLNMLIGFYTKCCLFALSIHKPWQ